MKKILFLMMLFAGIICANNIMAQMQGRQGNGFSLAGRSCIGNLPTPIYGNNKSGRVLVDITVDATGKVIEAKPRMQGSTTDDSELIAAAVNAAKQARFNAVPSAGTQSGTITYSFIIKNEPSTPENDQLIKTLEQAICKGGGIKDYLLGCGFKQIEEVIAPNGTDEDYYVMFVRTYVDKANKLIFHTMSGEDNSCWLDHEIKVRLIFTTHKAFETAFNANGYQPLLYEDEHAYLKANPNNFILRKKYATCYNIDYFITVRGEYSVVGNECIVDVIFCDPGVPVGADI